ncbi:MAG: EAL domain-containing protein [Acidimicrobiales bacterium]
MRAVLVDGEGVWNLARHVWQRIAPTHRVVALVALLVVIDGFLISRIDRVDGVIPGVELPFPLVVALFAIVEWRVIHIQFRAEASSFSMLEVPLVLGLLYLPPLLLVLGVVVGVALGLAAGRRQPLLKVLFNVANVVLYATAATMILTWLPHGGENRWIWLSVMLATAVGSMISLLSIIAAITATEGAPSLGKLVELAGFALAVSSANTTVGLTAAVLLSIDAFGLLLLALPALLLLAAFRMFASERAQRERVEFLYRSTRSLDVGGSKDGLVTLLDEAREMFRAEIGAVVLLGENGRPNRLVHSSAAGARVVEWIDPTDQPSTEESVKSLEEPVLVSAGSPTGLAPILKRVRARDAMIAKLATDERDLGVLLIANRLGQVSSFTGEDLQVLGALARQSALLMHSDRLEQALFELRKLERRLAHQATHDSLTGLADRSLFNSRLGEAVATAENHAVLFIDLDDFKIVNDTYGHAHGDEVLIQVSERIQGLLRPIDVAARLGGDEFAVLLRGHPEARQVAERLVAQVSLPFEVFGTQLTVGCSVGLATSGGGHNIEELLRRADAAMYAAKQSGKGSVVEYTSQQWRQVRADLAEGRPVVEVDDAIAKDQMELHYQPVVDVGRGQICGIEALVRWRSPDRGLVMPAEFIGQAEQDGCIISLDRWVVRQAAADLPRLLEVGGDDLFVSVNLSAGHLRAPDLVEWLSQPELTDLRHRLVLELTETALIAELDRARSPIDALQGLGARIALDGFGTGYSSLGYLRSFSLDMMKVARPTIEGVDGSVEQRDYVRAIVGLGHAIGLTVVAEGVERTTQVRLLAELGFDSAQGYHFARPMQIDDLLPLVRAQQQQGAAIPVGHLRLG